MGTARDNVLDLAAKPKVLSARHHHLAAASQQLCLALHPGDGDKHAQGQPPYGTVSSSRK